MATFAMKVPGMATGSDAAKKREAAAKPTVDKPDAAWCESALRNGFPDIEAELVLPDGQRLPVTIAHHCFSTGTLGWQGRVNTVARVKTHGGAERNYRINGDFKVYIGGSGEVVKGVVARAQAAQNAAGIEQLRAEGRLPADDGLTDEPNELA